MMRRAALGLGDAKRLLWFVLDVVLSLPTPYSLTPISSSAGDEGGVRYCVDLCIIFLLPEKN